MRFAEKQLKREDEGWDVEGGSLVMKYFVNQYTDEFLRNVPKPSFKTSVRSKAPASRSDSSEFHLQGLQDLVTPLSPQSTVSSTEFVALHFRTDESARTMRP